MIDIEIPGSTNFQINHLVLDYNGTLALDGELLEGVAEGLHPGRYVVLPTAGGTRMVRVIASERKPETASP